MLSNIYRSIGLEKEAERVMLCGVDIKFCNDSLCARCNTLKERLLVERLDEVMRTSLRKYDVITLNLGCYAVESDSLNTAMTNINNGVMDFINRQDIINVSKGMAIIEHVRLSKGSNNFKPFVTIFVLVDRGITLDNKIMKRIWKNCMGVNSDLKVGVCYYKKADIIYPVNTLKLIDNDFSIISSVNKSVRDRNLVILKGEVKDIYKLIYPNSSTDRILDNILE